MSSKAKKPREARVMFIRFGPASSVEVPHSGDSKGMVKLAHREAKRISAENPKLYVQIVDSQDNVVQAYVNGSKQLHAKTPKKRPAKKKPPRAT
jgi:hypothetical protein